MLLRYKKAYEKIAMGLLSYMPGEKVVKKLQETIYKYENDDCWHLYLLKQGEDFIGLVGVEVDENSYTVMHLSVNPSFRGEGIGSEMIVKLAELYPNFECKSNEYTKSFMAKCLNREDDLK
ncbi:GNAT family N-acetyltransferase [Sporosarcina highlanderae]|uniref:GNAT family N-acetyltransferase n=1 Tax=Sporosarcina highlanderae TaxID=3035916 RepID=A0ABT8JQH1_9BACL|nr:GNAT family N-acetyltransferase [Sporosarcina highlanderae]MDN4607320.1 GNAT family N-acetyltransferase [Sporosarcina highlanderae]